MSKVHLVTTTWQDLLSLFRTPITSKCGKSHSRLLVEASHISALFHSRHSLFAYVVRSVCMRADCYYVDEVTYAASNVELGPRAFEDGGVHGTALPI